MIKNVIFDFGGVLVDWNPRYLMRKVLRDEAEVEFFLSEICTPEWNERQDGGRPFAEGLAEVIAKFPEYEDAINTYYLRWPEMIGGSNEVNVRLLYKLKAAGYGIYGLTNWSAETIHFAMDTFDFFAEMDGIVVSGREKLLKPMPEIYQLLLSRYKLNASECCFVDDNQANLDGAAALGIAVPDIKTVMNGTWARELNLQG